MSSTEYDKPTWFYPAGRSVPEGGNNALINKGKLESCRPRGPIGELRGSCYVSHAPGHAKDGARSCEVTAMTITSGLASL